MSSLYSIYPNSQLLPGWEQPTHTHVTSINTLSKKHAYTSLIHTTLLTQTRVFAVVCKSCGDGLTVRGWHIPEPRQPAPGGSSWKSQSGQRRDSNSDSGRGVRKPAPKSTSASSSSRNAPHPEGWGPTPSGPYRA